MTGIVFNIQKFSVDDGPGIRTLVFLKGCPLRCSWCSNPESQIIKPQVMFYPKKCKGCGKCIANCPEKCVSGDSAYGIVTDHERCVGCGICTQTCYYSARELLGKAYTTDELMEVIMDDYDFYRNSGGGVTFSGGEPLMQHEFLTEVLRACKDRGIHTAMETCGYALWSSFEKVIPHLDLIFYDYKHNDDDIHKKFTGVGNERIKRNLEKLSGIFKNIVVRIPYIPGVNDNADDMEKMLSQLKAIGIRDVEVLPYHRIGSDKYLGLGMPYAFEGIKSLKAKDILLVEDIGSNIGLNVSIRGKGKQ